jgi:acyl-coenzyme A thioesterase PaaI-like protein
MVHTRHLVEYLGITGDTIGDGEVVLGMPLGPGLEDAWATVLAGGPAALADTAGGVCAARAVDPVRIATADLALHCVAAAVGGTARAQARVAARAAAPCSPRSRSAVPGASCLPTR